MTTAEIIEIAKSNGFRMLGDSINKTCLLFRNKDNQDIYLDINIDVDEDEDWTHEVHIYNGVTDEVIFSEFMSESNFNNKLEEILRHNKGEF